MIRDDLLVKVWLGIKREKVERETMLNIQCYLHIEIKVVETSLPQKVLSPSEKGLEALRFRKAPAIFINSDVLVWWSITLGSKVGIH